MRAFFIFLIFLSLRSDAQKVISLSDTASSLRITSSFEFFLDSTSALTRDEVLNQQWFSIQGNIANFQVTKSRVWCHSFITAEKNGAWKLSIEPSGFSLVEFHHRRKGGDWKLYLNSSWNDSFKKLRTNHLLFPLELSKGDTVEVLITVKDFFPIQAEFRVGTLEAFVSDFHGVDLFNGLCYGVLIMMMIYNLYLFITQKLRIYIYYVLYVFFSLMFTAHLSGYGFYFPKWMIGVIMFAPVITPVLFGCFAMFFTLELFKGFLPKRFVKFIYVFLLAAVADVVVSIFDAHLGENLIQVLGVILSVTSIVAGIIAYRKDHSAALNYLAGFGAYNLCLMYLIMAGQNIAPQTSFMWCLLAAGSVIEAIFLAFALGDKMKFYIEEKELAQ